MRKKCPEGTIRNPDTKRCRKVRKRCPEGTIKNPNTGRCRKLSTPLLPQKTQTHIYSLNKPIKESRMKQFECKKGDAECYFQRASERSNEDKMKLSKISLIGPVSCYYFDKLQIPDGTTRNILLLGDWHESLDVNHCCATTRNVIQKTNSLMKHIVDFFEFYLEQNEKGYEISDLFAEDLTDKIKTAILDNIDSKCLNIIDYLYLISNVGKGCVDIFDESSKDSFIGHKDASSGDLGYLTVVNALFQGCKIGLCTNMFKNIRYHYTNVRAYMNLDGLEYEQNVRDIIPRINTEWYFDTQLQNLFFDSIEDKEQYIIRAEIENNKNHNTLLLLFYFQHLFNSKQTDKTIYSKIYLNQMSKEDILFATNVDLLIKKQYEKSIFRDNVDEFLKALGHVVLQDIDNIDVDSFHSLEMYRHNLYLLCRMFIKKNMWEPRPQQSSGEFFDVTEGCKRLTYPKDIIVYVGDDHTNFCKQFIMHYFRLNKKSLKINIPPRESRCIKLDIDTLPFLQL